MRKRHARLIRAGITEGRRVFERYAFLGWDAFSRGMNYAAWRPKNKLEAAAYRRTWHRLEGLND